jgi:hypothetical protein
MPPAFSLHAEGVIVNSRGCVPHPRKAPQNTPQSERLLPSEHSTSLSFSPCLLTLICHQRGFALRAATHTARHHATHFSTPWSRLNLFIHTAIILRAANLRPLAPCNKPATLPTTLATPTRNATETPFPPTTETTMPPPPCLQRGCRGRQAPAFALNKTATSPPGGINLPPPCPHALVCFARC